MPTFKRFEEIIAWQKARLLCSEIFLLSTKTALSKDYQLKNQINDASGSVMDNIAEGFGRGGNAEFTQHLEISHASACECQSQLYRIFDRKYVSEEKFKLLYKNIAEIKRLIMALINYLQKTDMKGPKYKARENKKKNR